MIVQPHDAQNVIRRTNPRGILQSPTCLPERRTPTNPNPLPPSLSPHLQRLVITSSVAAVVDPNPRGEQHASGPPYTMDERDWNEYSPKVIEEKGLDAPGSDKYRASKVRFPQISFLLDDGC